MKFGEYFDRIFIINLAERTDRRAEMMDELRRADLLPRPGRIEFFPAIKVAESAGFPNAGYHGCFRSHLAVLNQAKATSASRLLVFEDDAEIAHRFRVDEDSLIDQLRCLDWGIVYFGHALEAPADRPTVLKRHDGCSIQTHFYAVNGKYFERLGSFFEKILTRTPGHPDGGPMSPDGALHFFLMKNPDVSSYVTTPSLGTQRSSKSDLSPKWFDFVAVLSGCVGALRKVKRRFD